MMSKFAICSLMCVFAVSLVGGCAAPESNTGLTPFSPVPRLDNSAFYKADRSFDQTIAKKAYYDMMKAYHYPIPPYLRTNEFWTAGTLSWPASSTQMRVQLTVARVRDTVRRQLAEEAREP